MSETTQNSPQRRRRLQTRLSSEPRPKVRRDIERHHGAGSAHWQSRVDQAFGRRQPQGWPSMCGDDGPSSPWVLTKLEDGSVAPLLPTFPLQVSHYSRSMGVPRCARQSRNFPLNRVLFWRQPVRSGGSWLEPSRAVNHRPSNSLPTNITEYSFRAFAKAGAMRENSKSSRHRYFRAIFLSSWT